jgi:endonuclease/exonuclease/phosphatase (EEP) superfamily protein YafD
VLRCLPALLTVLSLALLVFAMLALRVLAVRVLSFAGFTFTIGVLIELVMIELVAVKLRALLKMAGRVLRGLSTLAGLSARVPSSGRFLPVAFVLLLGVFYGGSR